MLDKSPSTSVTIFTQPNKESNRFKNSSNNINGLVYRSINTDLNFNGSPQTKHDDGHSERKYNATSSHQEKSKKKLTSKKMVAAEPVCIKLLTHSKTTDSLIEFTSSSNSFDSLSNKSCVIKPSNIKKSKLLERQADEIKNDDLKGVGLFTKSENDDLATLSNLNEQIVLEQLKIRFTKNQIYTYIGDILIAMNPLKLLPIYGKDFSTSYQKSENVRAKLPPHIYATAENCYREMMRTQQSQCILISGESGSGKTETCKYLVQHLLNRTKPFEVYLNSKIEEVNPLLEAFGNAKTRINDNSSRFGKYLEIYFEQDGTVVGAKFKEYLLEKSRVAFQSDYESTFHIFSHLFAGLSCAEKLQYGLLRSPEKYRYMPKTSSSCMSLENEEKFNAIRKSMATIGFMNDDVDSLIKILISILLIGEVVFVKNRSTNNDAVQVKNREVISNVCELLELEPEELELSLISDLHVTRGEEIRRDRNMVQSCDVRDAFAKALYGRLFSWIVNQINHHIQPVEGVVTCYSIGLLDIFGFENFERNSFEQMCINLANEQLHQIFTTYIFKLEIQECLAEEIDIKDSDMISYTDNQIILDLFLEKHMGIFALLDEESRFPKATDESLSIKLHQTVGNTFSDVYIAPKNTGTSFSIVHYAGQVNYKVNGFLEKNRDFLPNNLLNAARNSNNFLMQDLFQCKLTRKGTLAPSDRQSRLRKSMSINSNESTAAIDEGKFSYLTVLGQPPSRIKFAPSTISTSLSSMNSRNNLTLTSTLNSNIIKHKNDESTRVNSISSSTYTHVVNQYNTDKALPLTVACHFKNSLHELIEKINKCKAYFIRCIKPNQNQDSLFIEEFVVKQLRYCSIMHACKIRKCGYPYRVKFEEFLKWYKTIEICLLKKYPTTRDLKTNNNNNNNKSNISQSNKSYNNDEPLQKCLKCLEYAKITNYKVGKTKLFLRYWHIDIFNSIAKKLDTKVLIAQKIIRGWLVRKRIQRMQQMETNKFLLQMSNLSQSIFAKLDYQKNFMLVPTQIKVKDNDLKAKIEINNNKKKFTEPNKKSKEKNPKEKNPKEKSEPIIKIISDKISNKPKNRSANECTNQNWPDMNEINSALNEFDLMLNEYEIDHNDHQKENFNKKTSMLNNKKSQIHSSTPILNNKTIEPNYKQQKPSPNSILSLVNNNNNKCDNTLKKRNALVAFEFKTLLDKVSSSPAESVILDEEKLNNEIQGFLPPFSYNDHFNLNISHQTQSPPSLSSSSSTSSSNHSTSSASYSSQQVTENFQPISPKENWTPLIIHNSPQRIISPPNVFHPNNRFESRCDHKLQHQLQLNSQNAAMNRERAGYAYLTKDQFMRRAPEIQHQKKIAPIRPLPNMHVSLNNISQSVAPTNNKNITIWREELNTKNNPQQQIIKKTELSQKVEDSKKFIPEWKKNLIKQKEMKKFTSKAQLNNELNSNSIVPETPELMKHNIFIKKGLSTHL